MVTLAARSNPLTPSLVPLLSRVGALRIEIGMPFICSRTVTHTEPVAVTVVLFRCRCQFLTWHNLMFPAQRVNRRFIDDPTRPSLMAAAALSRLAVALRYLGVVALLFLFFSKFISRRRYEPQPD